MVLVLGMRLPAFSSACVEAPVPICHLEQFQRASKRKASANACKRTIPQLPRVQYASDCKQSLANVSPLRGGVSKLFRCEAPFLHHREIEWMIMPSLRGQKPWTPPRM